ncbi:hypothetical protein ACN24M_00365 [Streptomyces microflavus]
MQLDDSAEGAALVFVLPCVGPGVGIAGVVAVAGRQAGEFQPQRDSHPGVEPGGDLRRPAALVGHRLRHLSGPGRGAGGRRRGGRTRQRVGHRIEEGPQQLLGLGQANRRRTGQRHRPGLGRHRTSQLPHPHHVLLVERPDTPGIET